MLAVKWIAVPVMLKQELSLHPFVSLRFMLHKDTCNRKKKKEEVVSIRQLNQSQFKDENFPYLLNI